MSDSNSGKNNTEYWILPEEDPNEGEPKGPFTYDEPSEPTGEKPQEPFIFDQESDEEANTPTSNGGHFDPERMKEDYVNHCDGVQNRYRGRILRNLHRRKEPKGKEPKGIHSRSPEGDER